MNESTMEYDITMTQERLKELLDYDPETGEFRWKASRGRMKAGTIAGCIQPKGHRIIKLDGDLYYAHRSAWLYVYGEWPENQIDHINGNPDDNRISNLRDVTNRENCQNMECHRNGKLVGAHYLRPQKWQARIKINGKLKSLGSYATEQEAHEAYMKALQEVK